MEMARIGTKTLETRFVCDFVVRNFEQLLASHPVGRSMSVPFCTYDMFKADFHVYPNGVCEQPGFLVTGIVRTDDIPKPVTASFGVKLLHPRLTSSVYCCKDFKERRWDPETGAEDMRVESRRVSVDAIRNHYLDETGSITLRVEFILKKNTFGDERMQRQITLLPDDRQRMNTDYINEVGSLLQSHTFADVVLIAQGKEFKAHRNILCARSSAFKSMLLGNMSESSSGCIEISDAAPETLASFLEFLYTGSCKVNAGGSAGSTSLEKILGTWHYREPFSPAGCFEVMAPPPPRHAEDAIWRGNLPLRWESSDFLEGPAEEFEEGIWAVRLSDSTTLTLMLNRSECRQEQETIDDTADMLHVVHEAVVMHDDIISCSSSSALAFRFDVLQPALQAWGDLLVLADKYCAVDLITFCESKLINWLCVPTAAFILKVASEASRRELKLRVLAFITLDDSKMHAVHDTRSFDDLPRELQLEVMEACMNIKQSRKRSSVAISGFEFPDNSDWMRLSNAQLRRACAERSLSTADSFACLCRETSRETLLRLLRAQDL